MTLIKNTPWNLPSVYDMFEGDRFFDDFFSKRNYMKLPAVNIKENEKGFEVEMAIPGMKREDIRIEMKNNMVTVSGEKKEEKEEKEAKFHKKEFSYDSFIRSFTVPENVIADQIEAKCVDGVLKLLIPKKAEKTEDKQSKTISIS